MAIAVTFDIKGMTAEQYDRVLKDLEAAGQGAPDGRTYYIACSVDGGWHVVDLWESPEQLQKFSETLIPLLEAAGVTTTEPTVRPVHNVVTG